MRQLLHHSAMLLLFFCIISFCLMLSSAAITNIIAEQHPYASAMSKNTIQFEIAQTNGHSAFTNLHLLQFILENTKLTLLRESPLSRGTEIFSLQDKSDFYKIESGLDFTNSDMLKGADKIVSSKMLFDSQHTRTNRYSHEGIDCEIIGVYQYGVSRYYVPLISVLKNAPDLPATGTFYLDGADNTNAIFEKLKAYIASVDATVSVSSTQAFSGASPNDRLASSDLKALLLLAGGVSLLLLLNIHYVLAYWLDGRRTEIFIRWLTGSTNRKLLFYLTSSYTALALTGAATGILCASLLLKHGFFLSESTSWKQCLPITGVGLSIALFIGILFCILTLRQIMKQSDRVVKVQ